LILLRKNKPRTPTASEDRATTRNIEYYLHSNNVNCLHPMEKMCFLFFL